MAWKASSARCRSSRSWRQTPSTIGPCRATSAAKAASPAASRRELNRSRSCRSESPTTEPPSKSVPICWATDPIARFAMLANSPEAVDPCTRRHLIPMQNTVPPSAIVSQVGLENPPGISTSQPVCDHRNLNTTNSLPA